eukprot:2069752-Prymnesium_polylepis.1
MCGTGEREYQSDGRNTSRDARKVTAIASRLSRHGSRYSGIGPRPEDECSKHRTMSLRMRRVACARVPPRRLDRAAHALLLAPLEVRAHALEVHLELLPPAHLGLVRRAQG